MGQPLPTDKGRALSILHDIITLESQVHKTRM